MEPQRKSTDETNKTAPSASTLLNSYSKIFLAFFSQVQTLFRILSSHTRSFVEPHRCCTVKHWCLDEDIAAMPSRCLGLLFALWTFLSLVLVGQSTGENTKQWNEDEFIIYFDIERLPCKFVDENQRPSIDICTIRNSPELGTNLAQPPNFCSMMRH